MACHPRIDRPCPLGIDEQLRLDGWCVHCASEVHALDAFDDAGRREFMAARSGPVCVSYRVSLSRAAMLGATMAAGLMAGAAVAQTGAADAGTRTDAEENFEFVTVMVGGVADPQDATWIDDGNLPELPVVVEAPETAVAVPLRDPAPRR